MNNPAASYGVSIRKDLEFDASIGVLNSFIPTAELSGFVRLTTQIAWSLTNNVDAIISKGFSHYKAFHNRPPLIYCGKV